MMSTALRALTLFPSALLFTLAFPTPGTAQEGASGQEVPAAEKTGVTNEEYGFAVRYPSNWSASQTAHADPFDRGAEGASRMEVGVPGAGAPPEGWNRLSLAGPGAPFDLEVFAHEAEPRPLSELVEALRLRLEEDVRDPSFAVDPETTWNGNPAWEIVADLGWGRRQYVGVRAGGVRYVLACTASYAEPAAADCPTVLAEHVDLELLEARAEAVSSLVADDAGLEDASDEAEALYRRDELRAWVPDELPGGLVRTMVEVSEPRGALMATVIYSGDGPGIVLTVGLLGAEQMERYRERVGDLVAQGELTRKTHRGRVVYEGSDGASRTLALFDDGHMVSLSARGDELGAADLLAVLDALDLDGLAALADGR